MLHHRVDLGSFAFVMATGIVSVGASYEGLPIPADALLAVAAAAYVVLAALVVRARHVERGFDAFAFVAASGVLAARLLVAHLLAVPLALFAVEVVAWTALVLRPPRRGRPGGTWLLAVVATQAVAVVAAIVAGRTDSPALLDAGIAFWILGLALYPPIALAVALAAREFALDLWILMGALAISTLAAGQFAGARVGFGGAALAVWALASALGIVLAVGHGRALLRRSRIGGSAWTCVFPLGMYAVASVVAGDATHAHPVVEVGRVFFWVGLAAWAVAATTPAVRMLRPWPTTAPSRSSTSGRPSGSRSSARRTSSS